MTKQPNVESKNKKRNLVPVTKRKFRQEVCPNTGKVYTSSYTYICLTDNSEVKYQCEDCSQYFVTEEEFNKHKKYRGHCKLSSADVKAQSEFGKYIVKSFENVYDSRLPYICRFCQTPFIKLNFFMDHLKECHPEVWSTSHDVNSHHTFALCPVCQTQVRYDRISGHLWTKHGIKYKFSSAALYQCSDCDHRAGDTSSLSLHIDTVHKGIRNHVCDVCGCAFSSSSLLKVHFRTHTGERPYKCNECGKEFRKGSALRQHIPLHTGWKPYRCKLCDKGFVQLTSINLHLKTHHPQVPKEKWKENRTYERPPGGFDIKKCKA